MTESRDKGRSKPGPKPERLKLDEEDWKEAVKKALHKKPAEGWPTEGDDGDGSDDDKETHGP